MNETTMKVPREEVSVSRRGFLGALGATGAGLASLMALGAQEARADDGLAGKKGILFDSSKCVGCHYCEVACKKENGLPCNVRLDVGALPDEVVPRAMLSAEVLFGKGRPEAVEADDRDAGRYLRVVRSTASVGEGKVEFHMRRSCTHCGLCAQVCPSGALKQREDGVVDLDRELCIGCGYCYQACPFDVPRYPSEGDRAMTKCTGCASRIDAGLEPACVALCPTGALAFGDRASVAVSGDQRVAELSELAATGEDAAVASGEAHLYGRYELGGLGVMTVATRSDEECGLPVVPKG